MRAFRKHSSWYTKGFRGGAPLRERLMHVTTLAELRLVLATTDRSQPFPPDAVRVPRGKSAGTQKVALPDGYLDDLEDATPPGVLARPRNRAALRSRSARGGASADGGRRGVVGPRDVVLLRTSRKSGGY